MSVEEREGLPVRAALGSELAVKTGQRQDFTYRKLQGLRLADADFAQSLFIGALIIDCVFERVDFSRCDFSGSKFVDCAFEDCRLSLAEIRSCQFDATRLSRCDLATSQTSHTDCRGTKFERCSFEGASLFGSSFSETEIARCSFRGGSVTSVDFSRCRLADTGLADCTALFLFFNACAFENFTLNAESVGLTYGLSAHDLRNMHLVHLGLEQTNPEGEDLVAVLATSYRSRNWYVGAAALEVNFKRTPTVIAVKRLAAEIRRIGREGLPLDVDELEFFLRILERLKRDDRLPFLATHLYADAIQGAVRGGRGEDRFAQLLSRLDRLLVALLDEACAFLQDEVTAEPLLLKLTMSARPVRALDVLCQDAVQAIHGKEALLEFAFGRQGSWIEAWQMTPGVLGTVHLVLLAVNGLIRDMQKVLQSARSFKAAWKAHGMNAVAAHALSESNPKPLPAPSGGQLVAKVEDLRRQVALFTDESLQRVVKTLEAVDAIPDADLVDLQAYAPDNVLLAMVESAPKRARRSPGKKSPKRAPRKKAPSA